METYDTRVDPVACIGCGICVTLCPVEALSMDGEVAVRSGDCTLGCSHCAASCPEDAITVPFVDHDALDLQTVTWDRSWEVPGTRDVPDLVRLMASRRSCRSYTADPVERAVLEDLVRIGITAPSGTNSQGWTFTIVPDRASVERVGDVVSDFFRRLNRLASRAPVRLLSRVFDRKDRLGVYYRDYYESVKEALDGWERERRDRLFHGATAAILVGAAPGASCPSEDALLASQNILLAAHAMGLGTCLIGFVVEAMRSDRKIAETLGIPRGEKTYAVIAIGHPAERYRKAAGRKKVTPRYFEV
jgi:nitroreductase/NAD-dependent dihydropyrimidine dehydrogenase PreA subunit